MRSFEDRVERHVARQTQQPVPGDEAAPTWLQLQEALALVVALCRQEREAMKLVEIPDYLAQRDMQEYWSWLLDTIGKATNAAWFLEDRRRTLVNYKVLT